MHNKINRFSVFTLLIISLILQLTVLDYVKVFNVKPDLILLLVIFFGLFFGSSVGLEAGFVAGLLKDILSLDVFGVNTLILAVTGLVAGVLSPKFFKESVLTRSVLVFAFSFLSMSVHYSADFFISKITYIRASEYLFASIIPSSIYTSLISLAIFPALINKYHLDKKEEFL